MAKQVMGSFVHIVKLILNLKIMKKVLLAFAMAIATITYATASINSKTAKHEVTTAQQANGINVNDEAGIYKASVNEQPLETKAIQQRATNSLIGSTLTLSAVHHDALVTTDSKSNAVEIAVAENAVLQHQDATEKDAVRSIPIVAAQVLSQNQIVALLNANNLSKSEENVTQLTTTISSDARNRNEQAKLKDDASINDANSVTATKMQKTDESAQALTPHSTSNVTADHPNQTVAIE